uniref:glycoside hydrolase family 32 protein n=1 Tax=Streptococcus suis TaxID=1307 RepID=UPI0012907F0B
LPIKTKVVADWTEDSLQNRDFRDPKVFRWEDKWFMVIAGGPLRIYSSDNLQDWTEESAYADLHMECPDLYPIQADDGVVKWVLSRGGRGYKVGNFTQVDRKWRFVADSAYETTDGIMNFGKDSYAAMTYYIQDFGNAANPTLPDLVELNWMNNWDYCRMIGYNFGQEFNGTYNLYLKLGLVKEGENYRLTQTPIKAYESLRDFDNAIVHENLTIDGQNDLFNDFAGDSYELVARFVPSEGTKKVGFVVRSGENEGTKVIYDVTKQKLSIDRSKSGRIMNSAFVATNSQAVKLNEDGSIDLHIFVDRASVEVFAQGHTVAGANQIFPDAKSLGLDVIVEGESASADIVLYPLKSIWTTSPTPPAEEKPETPEKQPTETQGSEELPPSPMNTDKKDAEQNGQTSQTIPSPKPLATANQDKKIPQSGVSQTIQEKGLTSSEVARQSKPTLPNTGEVISFGGLAGLALLIGTVGYRKRRRED